MQLRPKTCIALLAVTLGLSAAWAQVRTDAPGRVSTKALMVRKLESAQDLLKGLALEDFDLIQRRAQTLQLLSLDAGWNTIQTEDYARMSQDFRRSAQKMRDAAKAKNLDAAGLGYVRMTMTCIECHRHVRQWKPAPK